MEPNWWRQVALTAPAQMVAQFHINQSNQQFLPASIHDLKSPLRGALSLSSFHATNIN
jgi:hypothetical protein